jgi:hypothetical protein
MKFVPVDVSSHDQHERTLCQLQVIPRSYPEAVAPDRALSKVGYHLASRRLLPQSNLVRSVVRNVSSIRNGDDGNIKRGRRT